MGKLDPLDALAARWQMERLALERFHVGDLYGISMLLGAQFDEDADAERAWLAASRKALNGQSARDRLLAGDIRSVTLLVHSEMIS